IHLPTYNWNILQCLILIGGARLVLTLAYIKTKNLWVCTGAHILNDWATFGLAILGASFGTGN
ncbi:MAG: CPBP family glutamic-type intramembrane protease, partial [Sphingobium sp.]